MRISLWTLLWSILIQLVPLLFAQQTVNCTMSVNTSDPLAVAAMQAACIGASPTVVNPSQLCPCSSMVPDPANVGKTRCKENANTTCACPINTYKLFESHYYVCIMCLSGKFNPSVGMAYFNGVSTNTLLSFCSTCSKFSHYPTNISSHEVSFCVCFAGYETYSCTACKVRPTPRRISCVLLETKLLLSFVLLSITHDPSRANVLSSTLFGTLPFPRNSIALQWHSAASVLKV